jgi:hypothetical protein
MRPYKRAECQGQEPPAISSGCADSRLIRSRPSFRTGDEIPEPMVIALLRAGRGRHPEDDRPIAETAQLLRDGGERRSARRELAHENTKCRWRQLGWPSPCTTHTSPVVPVSDSGLVSNEQSPTADLSADPPWKNGSHRRTGLDPEPIVDGTPQLLFASQVASPAAAFFAAAWCMPGR